MSEAFAIGMDVGGTHTKIGLVNSAGRLLGYQSIPSDLGGEDAAPFLERTMSIMASYLQAQPAQGLGIALCSLINAEHTGSLLSVNAPALNGLNLKQIYEERFGLPVQVMNDVNAYALAEYHFGAGRGTRRLLCLGLGTGLAIAVILDGRLVETWGGIVADAGRIILDPNAEVRCKGGVRGSAEALCGSAAIERLGRAAYQREVITAHEIIQAAREGRDLQARQVMAEVGGHAGHLLAILAPVYFPQRIIITGGTSEAGEALLEATRGRFASLIGEYMQELTYLESGERHRVEIVKGELGPEAAMIGCAYQLRMHDQ